MKENDRTIFKYLNPIDNDIISELKDKDLEQVILYLDRYYLEYRNTLGIDKNITFGIEIEMFYKIITNHTKN